MPNEELVTSDKLKSPFLLAAALNGFINFNGFSVSDGVVYSKFSPKDKALTLIDQYYLKCDPYIPAQDHHLAIKVFWEKVNEARDC